MHRIYIVAVAAGVAVAAAACATEVRDFGTGGSTGCAEGLTTCGGACVDTTADAEHCGGCDVACPPGDTCAAGQCVSSCPPGFVACDGACTDPATSNLHCGAAGDCQGPNAGEACPPGHTCVAGACTLACPADLVACDGACIDPATSPTHCGATGDCQGPNAGQACSPAEACAGGACTPLAVSSTFLLNEWDAGRQHVWDPATNTLTLLHETQANDADCNAGEGSGLVWFVEHYNDQFGNYDYGSGTGVGALWMTPYAYPKHVTVLGGTVVVMDRNAATLHRYDLNGVLIGSVLTGGGVGQGMATDGVDLYVSVWNGTVSSFQRYDANLVLLETMIPNPIGLAAPNLVDFAYHAVTGHFFGLVATSEGGTGTQGTEIVEFVMGGPVVQSYVPGIAMDAIGQDACN